MKTDFTLTLTGPDGKTVWSRDVDERHVKLVAEFLQNNLGLILAARGVMDTVKGMEAVMQGLGSVGALAEPKRKRKR